MEKIIKTPARREILQSLIAAPILLGASNALAEGKPTSYAMLGQKAPKFSLKKHGGGTFSNANLKGKTTIVEFWGLWCPDCMADAPLTAQLAARANASKNLRFIGIHTAGRYGRWGSLDAYFKEKNYSYPVAIDDDKTAYNAFKMQWVPSYLIIDKSGKIADFTTDLGIGGIGVDALLARANAISLR